MPLVCLPPLDFRLSRRRIAERHLTQQHTPHPAPDCSKSPLAAAAFVGGSPSHGGNQNFKVPALCAGRMAPLWAGGRGEGRRKARTVEGRAGRQEGRRVKYH